MFRLSMCSTEGEKGIPWKREHRPRRSIPLSHQLAAISSFTNDFAIPSIRRFFRKYLIQPQSRNWLSLEFRPNSALTPLVDGHSVTVTRSLWSRTDTVLGTTNT